MRQGYVGVVLVGTALCIAQTVVPAHPSFELKTHRMDVDVDGAPTAYGPRGKKTLDYLSNARLEGKRGAPIVGYLMEHGKPVVQGPRDPAPGYYVSQTAFVDESHSDEKDVLRYVDATKINYIVMGDVAKKRGSKLGDFVAVYSLRTHRAVFGIVADDGNPSGDEGSLHLLQDLGYPFHDGKNDAVEEEGEILVRFYPGSNPRGLFFREQKELDETAMKIGLSMRF
jgi:hypothetical protein